MPNLKHFPLLCIALIGCSILSLCVGYKANKQRNQILRLESNLEASQSEVQQLRTKNGELVACANEQVLTQRELRSLNQSLAAEVEDMGVKLRRLQSATRAAQQTTIHVKLDTIYVQQPQAAAVDSPAAPCLAYSDPWLSATICRDSLTLTARDTITIVRQSRTRRFLFWTWHKYSREVRLYNHNPHVQSTAVESVEILN